MLCESAQLIDTKEAISQLSPISIFEFFALISEKNPILTLFPIIGLPAIFTNGWNLLFSKLVKFQIKLCSYDLG